MSITIFVKITPKASNNEIVGWENNELKIRIAAAPEKGEANTELVHYLSKEFKVSKSQIEITHGQTSRHKRLKITGLSKEIIEKLGLKK